VNYARLFPITALICSSVLADEPRKEKFLSLFEATSAAVICSEKSYLIRCYGHTQGNCFERVNPIAKECVRANSEVLPNGLDRDMVGTFSNVVGKCIEEKVRGEFKLPPDDSQCPQ
jgi:hypothetical protein